MSRVNLGDAVKMRRKASLYDVMSGKSCWASCQEHEEGEVGIVVGFGPCECGHCSRPNRYVLLIGGSLAYAQRSNIRRIGPRKVRGQEVQNEGVG